MFWFFFAIAATVGWLLDNHMVRPALLLIVLFGVFYLVDKWINVQAAARGVDPDDIDDLD